MIDYNYGVVVTRVLDGDTIDTTVDLGFNIHVNIRFRMLGYDSPETWRPKSEEERAAGKLATAYLESLIEGKTLYIESNKFGKYRWLGTLYILGDPVSINQKMVDAGHIKREVY